MTEPKQEYMSRKEAFLIWVRGDHFNRPLNQADKDGHLRPKKPFDVTPLDRNMIIRYNSSFLELVQPLYRAKGFIEAFYLVMFIASLFGFAVMLLGLELLIPYLLSDDPEQLRQFMEINYARPGGVLFIALFPIFLTFFLFLHCLDFLVHNTYPYTHSATRFCRKTRRVYAYAPRLSWLSRTKTFIDVSWDDAYFTLYNAGALVPGVEEYRWFLAMYELHRKYPKSDPIIVNGVIVGAPAEGSDHMETLMLGQWEFIRRYMEEGPESLPTPTFMLPIAKKRESFFLGWKVLRDGQGTDWFIKLMFLPFTPIAAIVRYIQMHIAPVLKWPEEVEAACKIEPDDPYHYEANRKQQAIRVNPK